MMEYVYTAHNRLETEQHFLLVCDLYNNERSELLNTVIRHSLDLTDLTNEEKFIMLMANKDKFITDVLGKYIFMCLKMKSSLPTIRDNHQSRQSNQSVQNVHPGIEFQIYTIVYLFYLHLLYVVEGIV